jgi:hypothetical protein
MDGAAEKEETIILFLQEQVEVIRRRSPDSPAEAVLIRLAGKAEEGEPSPPRGVVLIVIKEDLIQICYSCQVARVQASQYSFGPFISRQAVACGGRPVEDSLLRRQQVFLRGDKRAATVEQQLVH